MAAVSKIDANDVGLRISAETSLGVANGSAVWEQREPNSYADYGQQLSKVAREPITDNRQRKKGVVTDLDASGGFNEDLTQENLAVLAPGFFFAAMRSKDELAIPDTHTTGDDFQPASGGAVYVAKDLLYAQGFDDTVNNGLHEVSGVPAASSIPVTTNLVTATGQTGTIRRVGFEFLAGELDVSESAGIVTLTSSGRDFTELGLIPGEWIFIGGDAVGDKFTTAANNGFVRVKSIAAAAMIVDKASGTMATESSTTETIRIFFAPRIIKNENDPSEIVRTTYQLERTLGVLDTAVSLNVQSDYLIGAVPSVLQLNVATADKVTMDLSFMGTDLETYTGTEDVKAGTRPTLSDSDAFNTADNFSRIKLHTVAGADVNPTALWAFAQDLTITVDNTISPNKAVGTLGAFELTEGMFAVSGSMNVYFADKASLAAIRNNDDVTMDMHLVKSNQGISIDVPLMALGDGRPGVEKDQPIVVPLTFDAATGAKLDVDMAHTLLVQWWDYLPNAAG